jgi:hypothetical protein
LPNGYDWHLSKLRQTDANPNSKTYAYTHANSKTDTSPDLSSRHYWHLSKLPNATSITHGIM